MKTEVPLISVCIPLFETEMFLAQCLESVLLQDYDDFEVVIVSDASNGKDATSRKSATIEYNGTRVDTLIALEDFVFPYSYKNMRISYPTLIIDGATRAASAKNGFMYGLCIDKIILRSKEDGSETIVTP